MKKRKIKGNAKKTCKLVPEQRNRASLPNDVIKVANFALDLAKFDFVFFLIGVQIARTTPVALLGLVDRFEQQMEYSEFTWTHCK